MRRIRTGVGFVAPSIERKICAAFVRVANDCTLFLVVWLLAMGYAVDG
ncbi:MAG: hypothetical protein AAF727_13115 [Pseudomonadota bacterium]